MAVKINALRIALGILIKENHIAAAGGVTAAIKAAQALDSGVDIQVEVENFSGGRGFKCWRKEHLD